MIISKIEFDLTMPSFPMELEYLWHTYIRLRHRQAPGFSGPAPVGWQDIDAFARRSGIRLAPWEIEVIEAIDDAFISPVDPDKPVVPEGARRAAAPDDVDGVRAIMRSMGKRKTVIRKGK